jgi:glycosyltransferase involved in cell wall biosynthesis
MTLTPCTIICRNYIAQASVFVDSFRVVYPDADCVVMIVDGTEVDRDASGAFRVVLPSDLALPDFETMAGEYEPIELSTAVKPWLLDWMLDEYGTAGPIAYFDPDIQVVTPLVELEEMLRDHWCALTPHLNDPMPLDGLEPTEQALLLAGTYNLGFIGLSTGDTTRRFLRWWQDRLREGCIVDPENGFFVDQRYIDFVPGLFDGVGILRHDGYNVAYWNLATRRVAGDEGDIRINDLPLRFFHFSGFDPRKPGVISKHQNRLTMDSWPALRGVFSRYSDALLAADYVETATIPYGLGISATGKRLTPLVRKAYAAARRQGFTSSLFDKAGDEEFIAYLNSVDPEGGDLSRGLVAMWTFTPGVASTFPDFRFRDRAAFLRWCMAGDAATKALGAYVPLVGGRGLAGTRQRALGVNVVGYLNAELGVGEAARGMVDLLDDARIPVWPVSLHAPGSRNAASFRSPDGPVDLPFTETLLCVNADVLASAAEGIGHAGLRETRVTGLWWWETEDFPSRFDAAFGWVDQVIAGTTFVADAISRRSAKPVCTVPLPVRVGALAEAIPTEIGWPDGFVFYFAFDYNSVFRRKNPLGLVEAYIRAFSPDDGVRLMLKSVNGDRHAEQHAELAAAIVGRADIVMYDGFVDTDVRNRMTAACDCYVSLHRSEGFGLTMAEAMYLGKPVIGTAYSGNLDFMDERNSLLVPAAIEEIGPGAAPYDPAGHWAQPAIDVAAVQMRRIFDEPELRQQLGIEAAASIRRTHSTASATQALRSIFPGVADV